MKRRNLRMHTAVIILESAFNEGPMPLISDVCGEA